MKIKLIVVLLLISFAKIFAQYSGGSKDGYDKQSIGKSPVYADSTRQAFIQTGGSFDGYGKQNYGKSPVFSDSTRQAYIQTGGSYDGYGKLIYGKSPVYPDSLRQAYIQSGGTFDGYGRQNYGKSPVYPDSSRQAYIQSGGTYDGYGRLNYGKSPVYPDSICQAYIQSGGTYDGYGRLNYGKSPLVADSSRQAYLQRGASYDGYGHTKVTFNLNQPILKYPEKNAVNMDTLITFRWEIDVVCNQFHIQISKYADFSSFVLENKSVTNKFITTLLNKNIFYFWRVRSIIAGDTSAWSDAWKFKTESGPYLTAPVLSYPINNSGFINTTSSFGWNVLYDADYYQIQFSKKSNFSAIAKDLIVNDSSLLVYNLSPETKYYWRVRAVNRLYTSAWSSIWNFNTSIGTINGIVTLITPTNTITNQDTSLSFKWTKLANCTRYIISIFLRDSLTFVKSAEVSDTSTAINGLNYNTKYTWGVVGLNNADTSSYSEIWSFTTKTFPVRVSWAHSESSISQSIVQLPLNIVCKVATRDIMNGDAVGLFYKRNDSLFCGGFGIWSNSTLNITVFSDDVATSIKDGFLESEIYSFKFWDGQLGLEYDANAEYHPGSNNFFTDATTSIVDTLKVITTTKHYVKLNFGWNLISSFVKPSNDTVKTLFNNVKSNVVIVKNNAGKSYIPAFDIDDIKNWNFREGYKVYMSKSDSILVEGIKANPLVDNINVKTGWNMVSYLRDADNPIIQSLTSLTDRNTLVIAKNNGGNTYIPQYNIDNIINMKTGQGYQMYMSTSDTLVYPANNSGKLSVNKYDNYSSKYLHPENIQTGNDATLLVEIKSENNSEIGVYNQENILVGSGIVKNNQASITIWGDNPMTDIIDGAIENEDLKLKLFNPINSEFNDIEFNKVESMINNSYHDKLNFKANSVYLINESKIKINDVLKINPNPVSNIVNIKFYVYQPDFVSISLYNLQGLKMMNILDEFKPVGEYELKINVSKYPNAEYNIIYKSGVKQSIYKLIIMK